MLMTSPSKPSTMSLSVRRLCPALGAEIAGVNIGQPIDDDTCGRIRGALNEHGILLFRHADITPEQHIAFSKRFGPLASHVVDGFRHPDHPEIFVVSNVKEQGKLKGAIYAGQYWHSDLSYVKDPSLGSLLHCHEMPEIGGDTLFANMYLAYDTLSASMKQFLGGLNAVHDYSNAYTKYFSKLKDRPPLTAEQKAKVPAVEHPVVRTHPETGRKLLYVNPGFTTGIVGMPEEESGPVLEFLFRHSTRPEFVYRHKWQVHDLIFWDNRCTMHYALADYDTSVRRHMYRTTLAGDAPF